MKKTNMIVAFALALTGVASADTVFDDGDAANSYIENANNWDNGAPSAANPGTISINAKVGLNTMTNWVVTQTAGAITQGSFPNLSLRLKGGSWTMNGGSFSQRAHTYSDGAVFTMNDGSLTTGNNSYITVDDSGTRMVVNGGTVNADRGIRLTGGEFTLNGGTINSDTADAFGAFGFAGSGAMNFNGGTLTAGRFTFQGTTAATFGGSPAGSASFVNWGNDDNADRHDDDVISIDFLFGTQMALMLGADTRALVLGGTTNENAWAQALWDSDQLLYDGMSSTDLGDLSWADATSSTVGVGNGEYFEFTASGDYGGTLALVPEPATLGMIAAAGTLLLVWRRRMTV